MSGLLVAVLLFPGAGRGQGGSTPVETMTIPGDDSVIQSTTEFRTDHTYKLVISGTMERDAYRYDALYCWAGSACSTPQRGNEMQLGIGGTSWALDDFKGNGVRESIPYNGQDPHEYVIDNYHPPGNGHLFAKSDLIAGYPRFGTYTIKIFDLTPAPPPPTDTNGGGGTTQTQTQPPGGGTVPINTGNVAPGADQPAPGSQALFPPVAIAGTQQSGVVGLGGGLDGSVVVGEGSKTKNVKKKDELYNLFFECWLVSDLPYLFLPEGSDFPPTKKQVDDFLKKPDAHQKVFEFCMALLVTSKDSLVVSESQARSSANDTCHTTRIVFSAVKKKGKKKPKVRISTKTPPKKTARYSCLSYKDGKVHVKVDGRKKGGLRKHLGSKLQLGLIRPTTRPPTKGRVTLEFKKS